MAQSPSTGLLYVGIGHRQLCQPEPRRVYLVGAGVRSLDEVGPEVLDAFLASRPRTTPRSYNHLLGTVARLFAWLVAQGVLLRSPLAARPRRQTARRLPFLFDAPTARRLLDLAGRLPDNSRAPLRGLTYRTIFALLYGLGLRVGEVSRLLRGDVDLDRDLLVIRLTKFSKSRLVPFGPRTPISTAGKIINDSRLKQGFRK
jgi:integrase